MYRSRIRWLGAEAAADRIRVLAQAFAIVENCHGDATSAIREFSDVGGHFET
jgi:hypothetical protein